MACQLRPTSQCLVQEVRLMASEHSNSIFHNLSELLMFVAADASSFMTGQTIANDGGWSAV